MREITVEVLSEYLSQFSEGEKPIVPTVENADGTLDLGKTIDLPCYSGFKEWWSKR